MLHGTLTTFRRRCGKASCRCASGAGHESPAFTYTEGRRTKTLTLRPSELAEVTAAVARYGAAKAELEAAAEAGIAMLRGQRGPRGGRR